MICASMSWPIQWGSGGLAALPELNTTTVSRHLSAHLHECFNHSQLEFYHGRPDQFAVARFKARVIGKQQARS